MKKIKALIENIKDCDYYPLPDKRGKDRRIRKERRKEERRN